MSDADWVRYPFCATCNRPIVPADDQCRSARVLRSYMETCDCAEPVPRSEAEPLDVDRRSTQDH